MQDSSQNMEQTRGESDRETLIAEILERLRKEESQKTKESSWINSPFSVTVAGGAILALLSSCINERQLEAARQASARDLLYTREIALIKALNTDAVVSVQNLTSFFEKMRIRDEAQDQLKKGKLESEEAKRLKADASDARDSARKLYDQIGKVEGFQSVLAQIKATFKDKGIINEADEVSRNLEGLNEPTSNIPAIRSEVGDSFATMTEKMASEAKRTADSKS